MLSPVMRVSCVAAAVIGMIAGASVWRPPAQGQTSKDSGTVRLLDPAAPLPPRDPADRGATYYWLEGAATRVVTRFGDAVAVAERAADGDVRTRLTDIAGNELATFTVDRLGAGNDVLDFRRPGEVPIRAAGTAQLRPTLEWSNRQAYSLWKNLGRGNGSRLEWRGDLIRPSGSTARDFNRELRELRTEWPDGISATVVPEARIRRHPITGVRSFGTFFISRLRKDGKDIGSVRWEEEEKLLTWDLPSISQGYLNPERLQEIGGWPFTPDPAWGNVQSYAFYHFARLIAEKGFVARKQPGLLQKAANFFMPSVQANTAGCDGMHWLDNTILRYCCDVHDACYARASCTYRSWWMFWSSWQCTFCNMWAAYCFSSGGIAPYQQTP